MIELSRFGGQRPSPLSHSYRKPCIRVDLSSIGPEERFEFACPTGEARYHLRRVGAVLQNIGKRFRAMILTGNHSGCRRGAFASSGVAGRRRVVCRLGSPPAGQKKIFAQGRNFLVFFFFQPVVVCPSTTSMRDE